MPFLGVTKATKDQVKEMKPLKDSIDYYNQIIRKLEEVRDKTAKNKQRL